MRIPGFDGYALNRLDDDSWDVVGRSGQPLKWRPHQKDGRPLYTLTRSDGRPCPVQLGRIVLLAHAGPPPTSASQCCHRDGDPFNNDPSNLYWGTRSANARDSVRHGTHPLVSAGEQHPAARLSNAQVADIRSSYVPGRRGRGVHPGSISWLAARFGVHPHHVSAIVAGRRRPCL